METFQPKEKVCKICGGPHSQYNCTKKVDIGAKKKEYIERLKKGEPGMVEALKEAQKEGSTDIETSKEEQWQKILKGEPEKVEERKRVIREGKPPMAKEGEGLEKK